MPGQQQKQQQQRYQPQILYISRTRIEIQKKSFSSSTAITYTFFVSLFSFCFSHSLSPSLCIHLHKLFSFRPISFLVRYIVSFFCLTLSFAPSARTLSLVNSRKNVYITICSSWNHLRHLWLEIREMPNGIFKLTIHTHARTHARIYVFYLYTNICVETEIFSCCFFFFFCHLAKTKAVCGVCAMRVCEWI